MVMKYLTIKNPDYFNANKLYVKIHKIRVYYLVGKLLASESSSLTMKFRDNRLATFGMCGIYLAVIGLVSSDSSTVSKNSQEVLVGVWIKLTNELIDIFLFFLFLFSQCFSYICLKRVHFKNIRIGKRRNET